MSEYTGKLKISLGNSKLGRIPNLSLPPIVSCRPDALCKIDCYAVKFYRMYPNVRAAWEANLHLLLNEPDQFYHDLALFLALERPPRFRMHVAGDFVDEAHFRNACEVISAYSETKVLVFTKRYALPFHVAPENMQIILSTWPGMDLPQTRIALPWAWLDGDDRFDSSLIHIRCSGGCVDCGYQCWDAVSADLPVVFKKH